MSSSVKRQYEEREQKLAVLEESFASVQKEVTELRSCLREVERSRLEARRELQELRRQVRPPPPPRPPTPKRRVRIVDLLSHPPPPCFLAAEGPGCGEGAEGKRGRGAGHPPAAGGAEGGGEVQGALRAQAQADRSRDRPGVPQEGGEGGAGAMALALALALPHKRSPLQLSATQRRLVESESSWRSGERQLAAQLQEARGCEKKLQDEAKNLALRTQAAQDSSAQAGLLLSETQGRLAATEAELSRAEAARKDLEFRLSSIQSALTRTLGIGASGRRGRGRSPGGSSTSPGTLSRHQSISPLRTSLSPPKGGGGYCSCGASAGRHRAFRA